MVFEVHSGTRAYLEEFVLAGGVFGVPVVRLNDPLGFRLLLGLLVSGRLAVSDS